MAPHKSTLMAMLLVAALCSTAQPAAARDLASGRNLLQTSAVQCSSIIKPGREYTLIANEQFNFTASLVSTWSCPQGTCLFVKLTGSDSTTSDSMTGYYAGSGVALTRANGNPVTPSQLYAGICFNTGVSGQALSFTPISLDPLTTPFPWNMSLAMPIG